jgi:CBS domain-containing protein
VVSPAVKTCRSSDRVIDAFAQMVINHFSALGIEDDDSAHRQIISIITIKDVAHSLKDFSHLLCPVEQYVNEIRNEDLIDRAPTMNVSVDRFIVLVLLLLLLFLTASLFFDSSVGIVIKKFLAVQRHRMFVRNGNSLVGIITVSDLLKAFASSE